MVDDPLAEKEPAGDEAGRPHLPEEYYRVLLALPSCIVDGSCDNCGRCQH